MKKNIKSFVPAWILKWYRSKNNNKNLKTSKFGNLNTNEVFTEIYKNNYWKSSESKSGTGSEIIQTELLINELDKLLIKLNIESVLDLPCGDFKWMQKVDLSNINYLGADIVEELIRSNINIYCKESQNIKFQVLNLITDSLPKMDLIIVRDCLVHLPYKDIFAAIKNIKSSGSKYLLTTTFTKHNSNQDIDTGDWRRINLNKKPFNFSKPILIINENCTEDGGIYNDKSMALWDISTL